MNNELTQGEILHILQNSNSVKCGQPIWNSTEEYNKLKAIVECAVKYTAPKELSDWEIIEIHMENAFKDGYLNENLINFARAVLKKAR